jgi:hypothetical protein
MRLIGRLIRMSGGSLTVAAVVLGLGVPTAARGAGPASEGSANLLGRRVAFLAVTEARNPVRNHENGANCNYYSGALRSGAACGNGWRRAAWCADFARWTWSRAGATTGGLTAWAISFRTYGIRHRTWHAGASLAGVRPGDVIGYRFGGSTSDDHVGVVLAVRPASVTTVDGNVRNRITIRTVRRNTQGVSGYTRPAA